MARGLNNSWGAETQDSPTRKVNRQAAVYATASQLHDQNVGSNEVAAMNPDQFSTSVGDVDQNNLVNVLRMHESFMPDTNR